MNKLSLSLVCLCACSSGNINISMDSGVEADVVEDVFDSGIDTNVFIVDSGMEEETQPPPYVECVSSFTIPVSTTCPKCSARAKKCLLASFCMDSNNDTIANGFIDSCAPAYPMPCTFKTSCFDKQSYCLPLNDNGTAKQYWGVCTVLVAYSAIDQFNNPVSPYAGYDSCLDANGNILSTCPEGFDITCTSIYNIGAQVPCPGGNCGLSYYITNTADGGLTCQEDNTGGLPPGLNIDAFFVGPELDPNDCNDGGSDLFHPCFVSEY